MQKGGATIEGITADLGAELGKAREGMPRRRLPGSKPGAPLRIRPVESDCGMRKVAARNLALRSVEADFVREYVDTFGCDLHPDLRADRVHANPSFNSSDWYRKDDDMRWQFGVPPKGIANFAWVQHCIHHLVPQGVFGLVLANGAAVAGSSSQSGEGDPALRGRALIEADLMECTVAASFGNN